MKKRIGLIVALVVVLLFAISACSKPADTGAKTENAPATTEQPASTSDGAGGPGSYNVRLGIVQPGPEFYYQTFTDRIAAAAEYSGMNVTALLSEYSTEKEVANIEDLIAQGVDAITVFSLASETAQIDAQKCEEAGMPLFLTNSALGDGPADIVSMIGNSFYEMGEQDGKWVVENQDILPKDLKILEIQGQLGQGIAEGISDGFADQIALIDGAQIVHKQTANWIRTEAIAITEDSLMSSLDFNMIFVHNEDMCAGVVKVLKENDVLNNGVVVITQNGSDDGIAMIKAGEVLATCANPPSFVGGDVVVQMLRYFDGVDVPRVYDSPVFMIDAANVNSPDLVTWDQKWAISRVDEYFAGTYK